MNQKIAPLLALALAACGPDATSVFRTDQRSTSRELRLIPPPPLSLRYEPTEKEKRSVLDAVDQSFPGATRQVAPSRGTLSTLSGLSLPLRCVPGASAGQSVLDTLAQYPDIFRLDPTEWTPEHVLSCAQVDPAGSSVTLTRKQTDQTIVVRVRRFFQRVSIDFLVGYYLPIAPELELAMSQAVRVEEDVLLEAVQSMKLPYSTFSACSPTGEGTWSVEPGDELTLGKPSWSKSEDATGTTMWERRDATVLIAPAHVKPELLASNAYCPPQVGWVVSFNSLKGNAVDVKAGVGCVVCFSP